ncbi:MAG: hypothetical protein NUV75_11415 [Gallionella sp.]|nr:hypothetical protein [Gallionella sp.]
MTTATVSRKYQLSLPKALREVVAIQDLIEPVEQKMHAITLAA